LASQFAASVLPVWAATGVGEKARMPSIEIAAEATHDLRIMGSLFEIMDWIGELIPLRTMSKPFGSTAKSVGRKEIFSRP
jgi:hypothetical protein